MTVRSYPDPLEFKEIVGPLLMENEAQNCLGLGVIDTLITHRERYPTFYLMAVADGPHITGSAWMTPPYPLGISAMPRSAVEELVHHVRSLPDKVNGVVGPKPTVDQFNELWVAHPEVRVKSVMHQRIYELERVTPPPAVPGTMRQAGEADRRLLERWNLGFSIDSGLGSDMESAIAVADYDLRSASRYFWELGDKPVSMAGFGGRTPSGIRVSRVYTPPPQRGRGYATALVAAMSQRLLDQGRKFCFLYTDLANPTSNSIYQRIGYRPVCDSAHYTFEEVASHSTFE